MRRVFWGTGAASSTHIDSFKLEQRTVFSLIVTQCHVGIPRVSKAAFIAGEELAFANGLVLLNVLIVPVLEYPNDNTSIGTVRFRFLGSSFLFTETSLCCFGLDCFAEAMMKMQSHE